MKKIIYSLAMIILCVQLSGCGGNKKVSEESKVVESFYNAIVNQERDKIGSIVCSDWEKDGLREVDAFIFAAEYIKAVDFFAVSNGQNAVTTAIGHVIIICNIHHRKQRCDDISLGTADGFPAPRADRDGDEPVASAAARHIDRP